MIWCWGPEGMTSLPSAGEFEGLPDAGGSSIWSTPQRGRCVARCVEADPGPDGVTLDRYPAPAESKVGPHGDRDIGARAARRARTLPMVHRPALCRCAPILTLSPSGTARVPCDIRPRHGTNATWAIIARSESLSDLVTPEGGAPQPGVASRVGDAIEAARPSRPPSATFRASPRTSTSDASRCTISARLWFRRDTHSCDAQIQSLAPLSDKTEQPMRAGTDERTYSAISSIVYVCSVSFRRKPICRFRTAKTRCA